MASLVVRQARTYIVSCPRAHSKDGAAGAVDLVRHLLIGWQKMSCSVPDSQLLLELSYKDTCLPLGRVLVGQLT